MKAKTIIFLSLTILLSPLLESCSLNKDKTQENITVKEPAHEIPQVQKPELTKNDKEVQGRANYKKTSTPQAPPPPIIEEIAESEIFMSQDMEVSSHAQKASKLYAASEAPINNNSRIVFQEPNTESYQEIIENSFKSSLEEPLSTFSLDVDRASYSNIRRMLLDGYLPDVNAVRIEEMINYFNYQYEEPKKNHPIAMHSTLSECPWSKDHQIMHIGIQGKKIATENLPPSNLVFLLDVSGSMNSPNKLPLVKSSLKLLLNQLRPQDRVAIVTYAGRAGVPLQSTSISEKQKIINALDNLHAGGSTAGAQGIKTAYKIAKENFIDGGNNRVILATDGDFNVGVNSPKDLEKLIEEKRKSDIFLSVLGFGTGNYKDHQMQVLANKGNGNHAYIDNMLEAQKILVNEFGGTMFTIAKDVKIQIEFNPAYVSAYRLIGYENRMLNKEDFNDDTKDAGEIGSGHSMTAIYEIIPAGVNSNLLASVDDLKYQSNKKEIPNPVLNNELATLKFRYKLPDEDQSKKIIHTITPKANRIDKNPSEVNFAMAVAEFGMLLRGSKYSQQSSIEQIVELATVSNIPDKQEFLNLVSLFKNLKEAEE